MCLCGTSSEGQSNWQILVLVGLPFPKVKDLVPHSYRLLHQLPRLTQRQNQQALPYATAPFVSLTVTSHPP